MEIFDYDNILLLPRRCAVESRHECDPSVEFGPRRFKIPAVPANMRTVVDDTICEYLAANGYFYIQHRFDIDNLAFARRMRDLGLYVSISLGVKQLEQDPMGQFTANTQKGAIVKGTVKEVDAKGAVIDLDGGLEGYVKANDIAKERVEDATQHLKVGDVVEAKYIGNDRKGRVMQLSIRAKDEAELQETMAEVNKADASSGTTKLGALLRE